MAVKYQNLVNILNIKSPDVITRAYIGKAPTQPYISGKFYIIIDLPDAIFNETERDYALKWLSGTAINFTPHSSTLNRVDNTAYVQSSYPTGVTITRDITVTYQEYQGSPIYKIHRKWKSSIFDEHTGLSALDNFVPSEYKGTMIVIQTKPVGAMNRLESGFKQFTEKHIEKVYVYPGVWPIDDNTNAFDAGIGAEGIKTITIPYTFDGYPLDDFRYPELKSICADFLNKFVKDNKSSAGDDLITNLLSSVENLSVLK